MLLAFSPSVSFSPSQTHTSRDSVLFSTDLSSRIFHTPLLGCSPDWPMAPARTASQLTHLPDIPACALHTLQAQHGQPGTPGELGDPSYHPLSSCSQSPRLRCPEHCFSGHRPRTSSIHNSCQCGRNAASGSHAGRLNQTRRVVEPSWF